jgi:hypothetical protein
MFVISSFILFRNGALNDQRRKKRRFTVRFKHCASILNWAGFERTSAQGFAAYRSSNI